MRPLEALFLVVAFVALVASWPFKKPRPQVALGLCAGALLLAVVQALVEKNRWQLYPAHLVVLLFGISAFVAWRRQPNEIHSEKRRRWPKIVAVILGMSGVGVSVAVAVLLPVFAFDPPTGRHAVGMTSYEWVDNDRTDEHPKTPSGHRRLEVQVWYPAAASDAAPAAYFDQRHAEGFARGMQMPPFLMNHLPLVRTNGRRDLPLASGGERFPVVVFSHGYPLPASTATFAAEELASHGYVVFSISHTYDTAFVLFQDGTSAYAEMTGDIKRLDKAESFLGPRISIWVADARFVLNEITKLEATDVRFRGRLDLDRIGYLGLSFGGATAYAALAADARFKAAVNMDGAYFGIAVQARPTQPYMLMNGDFAGSDKQIEQAGATRKEVEAFIEKVQANWAASTAAGQGARYRVKFAGVSHLGFSDLALMIPAAGANGMPVSKAHRLINQYTLAFFDQYLKGQSSPLLNGPAPDSAVTLTAAPAPPKTQ